MAKLKLMDKIKLGNMVKDLVSGFEGIATGEVKYMNGCEKWSVDGTTFRADGTQDGHWFDKKQVIKTGEGIRGQLDLTNPSDGGPANTPSPRF